MNAPSQLLRPGALAHPGSRSFHPLLKYACLILKPKRILEWGPGISTELMLESCPDALIDTIEHDPKYASIACGRLLGTRARVMRRQNDESYPVVPSSDYDLVFVDGRQRSACLKSVSELINAPVILHDCRRKRYDQGVNAFKSKRVYQSIDTAIMSNDALDFMNQFDPDQKISSPIVDESGTLNELQERLISCDPFTYIRFGDADLYFMNDPSNRLNRRHDPDFRMSLELVDSYQVRHPDYMIGSSATGSIQLHIGSDPIVKRAKLWNISERFMEERKLYDSITLERLYDTDQDGFEEFARSAFHDSRVLLIAGKSICESTIVRRVLNASDCIPLTDRNAYSQLDKTMSLIREKVNRFDIAVVAIGQATRVLAWRLWSSGARIKFVDIGSLVDALAGRALRHWILRLPEGHREEYARRFK